MMTVETHPRIAPNRAHYDHATAQPQALKRQRAHPRTSERHPRHQLSSSAPPSSRGTHKHTTTVLKMLRHALLSPWGSHGSTRTTHLYRFFSSDARVQKNVEHLGGGRAAPRDHHVQKFDPLVELSALQTATKAERQKIAQSDGMGYHMMIYRLRRSYDNV